MSKRIIIAGGGTGGHIFPALAIANALKKADGNIDLLFVGAKGKMEMEKVPQAGYEIRGLDIAGFNRSSLFKNVFLPFRLIKSFLQVRSIFKKFQPDAVVGVGGYSSFPVLRLAQAKGMPSFIHESNSFAGRSNQMLGKKATRIFVAAAGMEQFFPANKIIITGNPVRSNIVAVDSIDQNSAQKHFGLEEGRLTLLVVGGSLGARSINDAIAAGLEKLSQHGLQVIWQTGKNNAAVYKEASESYKNIKASEFITEMDKAYAAADIVVSRSGAMALTELCLVKKPVLFVPYPFAAEDHQTANARYLVDKNAALMIADKDAGSQLIESIISLVNDGRQREQLAAEIGNYAVKNADEKIASEILKVLKSA